ncbi:MAG: DUF2382 domain-containing protein [Chitinophagaceae bacterium]
MTNENLSGDDRLQELKGSKYEVATGQPDIRGWTVKDAQGQDIGEVDELIFDTQSLKVRYLVLDLEDNVLDVEPRDVLVPIGLAQLHEKDDDVVLPTVTAAQLSSLPEYKKGSLTADVESGVRNVFGGLGVGAAGAAVTGRDNDFYDHDHFNEDNLYQKRGSATADMSIPVIEENLEVGKKTVQTGGVRLQSRIVEQPVEETVRLREERVTVDREAVNRPATSQDLDNFKEGVIELSETVEVPVVTKEARVVEEISLGKETEERKETIRDTVRKTEVDVEDVNKTNKGTKDSL